MESFQDLQRSVGGYVFLRMMSTRDGKKRKNFCVGVQCDSASGRWFRDTTVDHIAGYQHWTTLFPRHPLLPHR